jgi:hypothetical protein
MHESKSLSTHMSSFSWVFALSNAGGFPPPVGPPVSGGGPTHAGPPQVGTIQSILLLVASAGGFKLGRW